MAKTPPMELKKRIKTEAGNVASEFIGEQLGRKLSHRSDELKRPLDAHVAALKEAFTVWLKTLSDKWQHVRPLLNARRTRRAKSRRAKSRRAGSKFTLLYGV
jgi:hypothetical protein